MFRAVFRGVALAAVCSAGLFLPSCDLGTPQSQIRGVSQSAPFLPETNERGDYTPYYATADLITPRYFHEGMLAASGLVYIFGGSDERGFAGLDTVEFFDQSTFDSDLTPPDSLAGVWVDTNLEGDPISMPAGARMFMTLTELSDNRIVLIGGSSNILGGAAIGKIELFDPITRTFTTLDQEMITPRFRHRTIQDSSGDILILGGQAQGSVTTQGQNNQNGNNPLQNGGNTGGQGIQTQQTVFPSTNQIEVLDTRDESFAVLNTISGDVSVMKTQRGRAAHEVVRVAGPDNRLNSSDDVYMIVGGYQTLSADSGSAPTDKQFGNSLVSSDALRTVEVFDPTTRIFTLIASFQLETVRVFNVQAVNLGQYNDFTPDGVVGMGNALLLTHGSSDFEDDVLIANYTPGAGPAGGLRFFAVEETRTLSHIQGSEYNTAITRFGSNTVSLKRPVTAVQGVEPFGTWVFALAGADLVGPDGLDGPTIRAGCVFDPYFSVRAVRFFNLEPTDLENERRTSAQNRVGIVGAWMTMDGAVTTSFNEYGTTPANRWARNRAGPRVWHKNIQLPGVDGLRNTQDDRILLAGGGRDPDVGGEPSAPSAEIFITPGSTQEAAADN